MFAAENRAPGEVAPVHGAAPSETQASARRLTEFSFSLAPTERLHAPAPGCAAGPHAHHQRAAAARGAARRHHHGEPAAP